jgi:hypothetical protein
MILTVKKREFYSFLKSLSPPDVSSEIYIAMTGLLNITGYLIMDKI